MTAAEVSARNWQYFKGRARKEVEIKCYTCEKFTILGKTCNGECVKE